MSHVREVLTPRQEAFAQAYVELDNASAAYRRAYDVGPTTKRETIWASAAREVSHPDVARRIRELRDAAAAGAVVRAVDLMRDWYDIATADPNEIVRALSICCRHCYGTSFKYQWRDEVEYAKAHDEYMALHDKWSHHKSRDAIPEPQPPDIEGGFGYDHMRDPRLECVECYGAGVPRVVIQDTGKLSPQARKLYKGAKQDRYGAIEVLMHDQEAARQNLARVLGAFKDGAQVPGVGLPEAAPIASDATDEAASRSYLSMVGK